MHDAVKAFSIISCACFQGCLPPSDILWSKEEFKGEYGALWGSHHIKKPGKVIVVLSGKIIRKDVMVYVLIHEMTHAKLLSGGYTGRDHGPTFKQEVRRVIKCLKPKVTVIH